MELEMGYPEEKSKKTKEQIAEWFREGARRGATHMFIVRDNFALEDYKVYVLADEDAEKKHILYGSGGDHTVMEIYSISIDMDFQLKERRAWHIGTVSATN